MDSFEMQPQSPRRTHSSNKQLFKFPAKVEIDKTIC